MPRTFYVAGRFGDIADVFRSPSDEVVMLDNTSSTSYEKLKGGPNDVLIFGGGEDINPMFYTSKPSKFSCPAYGTNKSISDRDRTERDLLAAASNREMKVVGVCRGAQLVFVCLGGKLLQHVTGHNTDHNVEFTTAGLSIYCDIEKKYPVEEVITSISSHHQMMNSLSIRCRTLMGNFYGGRLSKFYVVNDEEVYPGGMENEMERGYPEPDVIKVSSNYLLIQGHPEWGDTTHPYTKACQTFFKDLTKENKK